MVDTPSGWVKPERKKTLPELRVLIAEKQQELDALKQEASEIELEAKLQAIATARNIMRAHALSIEDIL
jgi:septal ring factor EnvC (AmiA/AmiB activator)